MRWLRQTWLRVCQWWEEYYLDNPIAWFWNRWVSLGPAQQWGTSLPSLEPLLQQTREDIPPEKIHEAIAQWNKKWGRSGWPRNYWEPYDLLKGLGSCFTALLGITLLHSFGLVRKGVVSSVPALFLFLPTQLLWMISLHYGSLFPHLLFWERRQGNAPFLWLTRLTGHHILFGTITALLLRQMVRHALLFILPLGWMVATFLVGDMVDGLWITCVLTWMSCTWALFWLLLTALMSTFGRSRTVKQVGSLLLAIGFLLPGIILAFVSIAFKDITVAQVGAFPTWGWWLSPLFPPIGMMGVLLVRQPLWGVLHGFLYLSISALLLLPAVRAVERERLLPEEEVEPAEGV